MLHVFFITILLGAEIPSCFCSLVWPDRFFSHSVYQLENISSCYFQSISAVGEKAVWPRKTSVFVLVTLHGCCLVKLFVFQVLI